MTKDQQRGRSWKWRARMAAGSAIGVAMIALAAAQPLAAQTTGTAAVEKAFDA